MPAPLLQLQSVLLKRQGGDRVMAELLACVPVFGLDAVLVAANLVVESGNASIEHVRNVLARLHETAAPPPLETPQASALTLTVSPTTDTGRYDRIRIIADTTLAEVQHG